MLVTPLVLIQIFIKRMLVDWPKCGSDPRDEGHLACLEHARPGRGEGGVSQAWDPSHGDDAAEVSTRDAKVGKHR